MKSIICLVFGVIILLMVTQFSVVHCRALQEIPNTRIAEQVERDGTLGMDLFSLSSSKDSNRHHPNSVRRLAFKLASGPSKKGPGN